MYKGNIVWITQCPTRLAYHNRFLAAILALTYIIKISLLATDTIYWYTSIIYVEHISTCFILILLFSLLTSLEINASVDCKDSEVTEDLDVTNLQLLLVVFHRLSTASQSDLLSLCVGSLIRVSGVVRYFILGCLRGFRTNWH